MKCFQSVLVLASLFAFAAPAWSGDAKLSAKRIQVAPQPTTQTRMQAEKALPRHDEGLAEEGSPQASSPSRAIPTKAQMQIVKLNRPDLTVEAVPPQGDTSMRFFIRNQGLGDSDAFQVSFLCSYIPYSNDLADPGLRQPCEIPTITVYGVKSGKVDTRQIPAQLLPQGPVLVSVSVNVDPGDDIDEVSEHNNSDSTSWN